MTTPTRIAFLIDSPNVRAGYAIAGTPARTMALARYCATTAEVTTVICDRGADYGSTEDWLTDTLLVHPADYYDPAVLATELEHLMLDAVVVCDARTVLDVGRTLADELNAWLVYDIHDDEATLAVGLGESHAVVADAYSTQRQAITVADAVIACATRETELARRHAETATPIALVPNGADPERTPWGPDAKTRRLVMIGNGYYRPNQLAVEHLAVMAGDLQRRVPGVVIDIIGRFPSNVDYPGLRMLGAVESIDQVLRGASLALAPLSAGTGSKCKVLDYAAAALPTLGTTEAVAGLPNGHPGVEVLDDLSQWPQRIETLLDRPLTLTRLGSAGRAMIEQQMAWPAIAAAFVDHVRSWNALARTPKHQIAAPSPARPRWVDEHTRQGVSLAAGSTVPGAGFWISLQRNGVRG
ncbi:MAG: glycosyltransferase [Nocardia sp.]|nr:glycosyltransferase [Nocardia sp.]